MYKERGVSNCRINVAVFRKADDAIHLIVSPKNGRLLPLTRKTV